jgi:hypothetical protein
MSIALSRAGHISSGLAAHGVRIILVLDSKPLAQCGVMKRRHIPGRINITGRSTKQLIDGDPVGYFEPGTSSELRIGHDAEAGHYSVNLHWTDAQQPDSQAALYCLDSVDGPLRDYLNAFLSAEFRHKLAKSRGKTRAQTPSSRKVMTTCL